MNIWEKDINKSIGSYLSNSYEDFRTYERFIFVQNIIKNDLIKKHVNLLDIGCAKGEFIYILKEQFPDVNYTGVDISDELLNIARKEKSLNNVEFVKGDARNFELHKQFDIVLMMGVLSIFDDYRPPILQMLKHIKNGCKGWIFGNFLEKNADVLIRYRNHISDSNKWESGLNMFSLTTIKNELEKYSQNIKIHKFDISVDLPQFRDNPVKSFTLNTKEKGKIITNGLNIITDFYLVEFVKLSKISDK